MKQTLTTKRDDGQEQFNVKHLNGIRTELRGIRIALEKLVNIKLNEDD